jgi:hypothetical protein
MKMTPEDLNNPEVMFSGMKKPEHVCGATDFAYAAEKLEAVCPACDHWVKTYEAKVAARLEQENPETAWVDENGHALPDIQVDPLFAAEVEKEEEDIRRHNDYVLLCHHGGVEPMGYGEWLEFDKMHQEHIKTAGSPLSAPTFQRLSEAEPKKDSPEVEGLKKQLAEEIQNKLWLHKDVNTLYAERDELEARVELLEGHIKTIEAENKRLEAENAELWEGFRDYSNRSTPANYALYPHYFRETPNTTHVDINWFLEAWGVGHTVGHAVKKLMCLGQRGVKGKLQDLEEARNSINRALELEQLK